MDPFEKMMNIYEKSSIVTNNIKANTKEIMTSLNYVINQKYAWNNSTVEKRKNMASKVLFYVQHFSFSFLSKQNSLNSDQEFVTQNIYTKTYSINQNSEIVFPTNESLKQNSIIIPEGTVINQMNSSVAFGAIIDGIQDYLLEENDQYKKINSVILSFSFSNKTETVNLSRNTKVR